MLTTIRKGSKSWFVYGLFGILIVAFAAWGIGDIFANRGLSKPVLEVGELTYSQQEFDQRLRLRLQQFRQQGLDINAEQFAALGGIDQIISQQTSQMLLRQYADKLDLTIPQAVAVADIQNNPAFRNGLGQFDRNQFLSLLSQNGLSEAAYVQIRQNEMRMQQLTGPAFGALNMPPVLADRVYAYLDETRTAEFLVIPDASMTEVKIRTKRR